MQNFSAGILIAAIGNELFPLMNNGVETGGENGKKPSDLECYLGTTIGFTLGILFMFGIDWAVENFADEDDEGGDEKKDEDDVEEESKLSAELLETPRDIHACGLRQLKDEIPNIKGTLNVLLNAVDDKTKDEDVLDKLAHRVMFAVDKGRRSLVRKMPLSADAREELREHVAEVMDLCEELKNETKCSSARRKLLKINRKMKHLHDDHVDVRFSRWKVQTAIVKSAQSTKLPWTTVFAVTVDAAVDGVLIGLSLSAEKAAGISMAVATVIEMGFLGLSFSSQIKAASGSNVAQHVVLVCIPPLFLMLSGIAGHELGTTLQESQGVFIGFIAFAIVAILFLVTQELLREAQEVSGENVFINGCFFLGLLGGVLMDRALD